MGPLDSNAVWTLENTGEQVSSVIIANALTGQTLTVTTHVPAGSILEIDGEAGTCEVDGCPIPQSALAGEIPQVRYGDNVVTVAPAQFDITMRARTRYL